MLDLGLLVLRVGLGGLIAAHGLQKLVGWFGGPGLTGTSGFFGSLGLRPARFWALVVALGEVVGGTLTAIGLLGPIGPALIVAVMLGAAGLVHWQHGFWNTRGGVEFPFLLCIGALALALTGSGQYALDRWLGRDLHEPGLVVAALGAAAISALIGLATTRRSTRPVEAGAGA